MEVSFNKLKPQYERYKNEYQDKAIEVLNSGWYVLGKELENFEKEFSNYIGSKYCVGLGSGLDALIIAFRLLKLEPGDEVIVQGNSYIACIMGITQNGLIPIFVEPDEFNNIDATKIEEKITEKTKAILVVHMYGQASNMNLICNIAKEHSLFIIEDCAQAHGAKFNSKNVGTFGDIACFSFYPSKNLGAFGDGGAITTSNEDYYNDAKVLRNYGSRVRYVNDVEGYNSRLDEIQAGLLRVKLTHLDDLNAERAHIANRYLTEIKNVKVELPKILDGATSVWHLFVVQVNNREDFVKHLLDKNIYTSIHYPIPPHNQKVYNYDVSLPITEAYANRVISLPLYNGMSNEEIDYVIDVINGF